MGNPEGAQERGRSPLTVLREEDAQYFLAHKGERYYVRDLFQDEEHPFLQDALDLQKTLTAPTQLKIVPLRVGNARAVARIPMLQRIDKPKQFFICREDADAKVFLRQSYPLDQMLDRMLKAFKKSLLLRGIIYEGKCFECGLCFRTGDMVGGDDVGTDVHLYCAFCMERRLFNNKKIDAAVIANIEDDDINEEEIEQATKLINEQTERLKKLVVAHSGFYDLNKYVRSHTRK